MTDGAGWLREYVERGSGDAFARLVAAYFDLVYSAAIRRVGGDAHLAQDVAQTVFTDLARKAKSLPSNVYLGGWLYRHTCFIAANTVRGERRRQARERQSLDMNAPNDPADALWQQLAPVLEAAMKELADADRDAILLRFFERQSFRVVGDTLGVSEDGARKRVERALEKLRGYFAHRGVAVSAVVLGETLSAQAVVTAPAGAAAIVASAALAGAVVSGGVGSTLIKLITMTKLKIAALAITAGAAAIIAHQAATNHQLREENQALTQQAAQLDELRAENERLGKIQAAPAPAISDAQLKDLLRLRAQVGDLKQQLNQAQKTIEKNARLARQQTPAAADAPEPPDDPPKQLAIAKMNFLRQAMLGSIMYAADHQGQVATNFNDLPVRMDDYRVPGLTNASNGPIYLSTDQFEIVYTGRTDQLTLPPSETISLREKQPFQTTDGGWAKSYAFIDGHCEIHKAPPDGNFEPWETEHIQPRASQ